MDTEVSSGARKQDFRVSAKEFENDGRHWPDARARYAPLCRHERNQPVVYNGGVIYTGITGSPNSKRSLK